MTTPKRPPVKPVEKPTAARTHARDDFHIPIRITVNIPQLPTVLDYLVGLAVAPYVEALRAKEIELEKFKTALNKARKSIDKLKAQKADAAVAEQAEDDAAATLKADLEAQIAALQKRVDEETVTPEELAELDTLVAELDELDGADEPETPEEPTEPPDDSLPVEEVEPEPSP